jgi:hypothetical protein
MVIIDCSRREADEQRSEFENGVQRWTVRKAILSHKALAYNVYAVVIK